LLLLVAALALAALVTLAAPAAAAPQTTLVDVEDEVMCPICGTLLELSEAPQAQRERALIAKLIAGGRTKAQIKDALVTEYGREVLALPRGSGFDLSAYLVPVIAFAVAAAGLAFGVARWRKAAKSAHRSDEPPGPEGEDAARLDADIARYDL
jgi:cytochrome c-type biogenesis protein CcmH